ncbi:hypothetical protein [Bacteriophage sp.]|nr:hypothetical protein [Bacteriophage sp.]
MSANNWRACPACLAERQELKNKLESELQAAYGKEPESQYQNRLKQIFAIPEIGKDFREGWEVGTREEEGKTFFFVDYYGRCERCKAVVSFNRHVEIQPVKGEMLEL